MTEHEIATERTEGRLITGKGVSPDQMGDDLKNIGKKAKKRPVQLTWENIVITA